MTSTPTIYELLLERSLSQSLRKALKHLIQVLASHRPDYFRLVHKHFDEFSLLTDFILEGLHLRTYHATFSENYYLMERIKSSHANKSTPPSVTSSLLALSLMPYVRRKLDKAYENLNDLEFNGMLNLKNDQLTQLFYTLYPYVISLIDVTSFICLVRFAVGDSSSPTLLSHLLSIKLVRKDSSKPPKYGLLPSLAKLVNYMLTGSTFFIQFLDYWYSNESSRWPLLAVNIPDAPEARKFSNCDPGHCPMCFKVRQNEAVLHSSGIAFCYECIHDFIQRYRKCPITGYPTNIDQVVRIYQNAS